MSGERTAIHALPRLIPRRVSPSGMRAARG
jgi:hypothetical protein